MYLSIVYLGPQIPYILWEVLEGPSIPCLGAWTLRVRAHELNKNVFRLNPG